MIPETPEERRKDRGDDEYVARTGDRAIIHRKIKRLVEKKSCLGLKKEYVYVEDTWPMIQGCFCGLCKGTSHVYNMEDWTDHQIFCCAEWGE